MYLNAAINILSFLVEPQTLTIPPTPNIRAEKTVLIKQQRKCLSLVSKLVAAEVLGAAAADCFASDRLWQGKLQ